MANVPAFNKAPAIPQIRAALARASTDLSVTSAPLAARAVPAAGLPIAAPPRSVPAAGVPMRGVPAGGAPPRLAVPVSELDDVGVPAAVTLSADAAPAANAALLVSRALAGLDAVPVQ